MQRTFNYLTGQRAFVELMCLFTIWASILFLLLYLLYFFHTSNGASSLQLHQQAFSKISSSGEGEGHIVPSIACTLITSLNILHLIELHQFYSYDNLCKKLFLLVFFFKLPMNVSKNLTFCKTKIPLWCLFSFLCFIGIKTKFFTEFKTPQKTIDATSA